jgi:glycosyltransferase involved in cell wall biosynthesis
MMRLLIVSAWLPHSEILHAGGQHLYQLIRSLSPRHEIHLLCYGRGESATEIASIESLCASLTFFTPAYTWRQKREHFRRGGWRRPHELGRRTHLAMCEAIQKLCHAHQIEVVHFVWMEMACYLDAVPDDDIGTTVNLLDIESRVRPREISLYPMGWQKFQAARRTRKLVSLEKITLKKADVLIVSSESDREWLAKKIDPRRIAVVSIWPGFDISQFIQPMSATKVVSGRLVFFGAMDRVANIAAVEFLVKEVWPLVVAKYPTATLRIVGANPPDSIYKMVANDPSITITGYVSDFLAEWAAADIAVLPSLVGGGQVTKILQAMASGRPVVTTAYGNEGIGATNGIELVIADTLEEFATAMYRLLTDRAYWQTMVQAGHTWMMQNFDWEQNIKNLEAVYQNLAKHSV